MDGTYDILLGGQTVGKANVRREGLYCCFDCRCDFNGEVMYRLQLHCGGVIENLGIPVPNDSGFELCTKLPVKRVGEGPIRILAVPKYELPEGKFIPLSPEEPFRYLKRLQNAHLRHQGEQLGVVILE